MTHVCPATKETICLKNLYYETAYYKVMIKFEQFPTYSVKIWTAKKNTNQIILLHRFKVTKKKSIAFHLISNWKHISSKALYSTYSLALCEVIDSF